MMILVAAFAAGVVAFPPASPARGYGTATPPPPPAGWNAPPAKFNPYAIMPAAGGPGTFCSYPFKFTNIYVVGTCLAYQAGAREAILGTRLDTAGNIVTSMWNTMNITASEAANWNATTQELLSYYSNRAEAVVPYFLNQSWTNLTQDELLTYSGLAPAIEGVQTAMGEQLYQNVNATVESFQNAFGAGAVYCCAATTNLLTNDPSAGPNNAGLMVEGDQQAANFTVSPPFQLWGVSTLATPPPYLWQGNTIYFNLAQGGTIVDANWLNQTTPYGSWTVTDLTTGNSYPVPDVTFANWASMNFPTFTAVNPIGPFDLLKAQCTSGCSGVDVTSMLEVSGGFAFHGVSNYGYVPTMDGGEAVGATGTPVVFVGDHLAGALGNSYVSNLFPAPALGVCIGLTVEFAGGACSNGNGTITAPSIGNATQVLETQPGQAIGANSFYGLAHTFQALTANVLVLAHAYYDVLRALTKNDTYAIPASCSIPFPSTAFPASVNPQVFGLTLAQTEIAYLSFLDANARGYGTSFVGDLGFCGDPNLGVSFNWSSTWNLRTNITASVYLGTPSGAVGLNGSMDPSSVLTSTSTWPIRNVDPTLLYPFELQANVPIGAVYPIPFNDPMAGVLINWTGNVNYGASATTPRWGEPTYLSLSGFGNAVYVNGTSSGFASGQATSTGDALYVSSCVIANVTQHGSCPISTTYFNSFTFGIVHAFAFPSCSALGVACVSPPGGLGPGFPNTNNCGFGGLNSWYDSWAGYVGGAVAVWFFHVGESANGIPLIGGGLAAGIEGLGCVVAWVVVILLVVFVAWVVFKLITTAFVWRARRR